MRYIKLYEEFRHDEIHDVMMSICDFVSFEESTEYPSTDRVRVYDVDSSVDFDPKQFEEYLDGWRILNIEDKITFVKGDLREAGLSWLNEIYGNLKPVEKDDKIFYVDGERKPLFMYYKEDYESKNGYYYINYDRIWSFFEYYFDMESKEIKDLIKVWLGETYNLRVLTPDFWSWDDTTTVG
jgi:hypothetical protein